MASPPLFAPAALPRRVVISYSLGHVLNDMTAACWFSYLLLYLEARGISPLEAGAVLFTGQLMDALATPAVGLLSDRSSGWPALGLGRRKLWNLGGALVVAVCFLGVFATCVACWGDGGGGGAPSSTSVSRTVVFALFAGLFNVGWAAVQVSHMALVPELTRDDSERVLLNSARYGMTVLSNCAVFVAMWSILRGAGAGGAPAPAAGTPGFDLAPTYATLSLVVVGVGSACTLFFLAGTPERAPLLAAGGGLKHLPPKQAVGGAAGAAEAVDALQAMRAKSAAASAAATADAVAEPLLFPEEAPLHAGAPLHHPPQMAARDWLGQRSFFQVMAVYSLTRLATNVSQVYLSFFVTDSLGMDQTAIALVPLLLYLAQLSATLALKPVAERFGRRNSMTLGAALVGAACGLMLVLDRASANGVYFAMLLLGAGSAICMVISVSLESDLIGGNTESGAFVYGACSFADKLSNGIAIIAVQFAGDGLAEHSDAKGAFIRLVNGLVPLLAIAAATAVCWTISFPRHLQSRAAQQLRDEPVPNRRRSLAEPLVASAAFDGGERTSLISAA